MPNGNTIPADTSTMFELIEMTRLLLNTMEERRYLTPESLEQKRLLLARAESAAANMPIGDARFVLCINDSGVSPIEFETESDRMEYLQNQDDCGDDLYTLNVAPDRSVEICLAEVEVPA